MSASRLLWLCILAASIPVAGPALAVEAEAPRSELVLAMDYVVPPFMPGAKVRTPETVDTALADAVAERLGAELKAVDGARGKGRQADGPRRLALTRLDEGERPRSGTHIVPTGYRAGPMAIMRSDTGIRRWEDLRGRTVCLSEGGRYVGRIAADYGAREIIFPAPADALLALRTGGCDATVHDDVMLNELLKFPEWKKFSARLPTGPRSRLVFMVPEGDAATAAVLRTMAHEWKAHGTLRKLHQERVRDIAFEVYLDQNVPDCH